MSRTVKLSAASGVLAPIIMVSLWTVASFLRPGYNQLTQRGSELGTGPNAIVMNTNFVVTGLLTIAFTLGLIRSFQRGSWAAVGTVFLGVAGLGEVAAAVFPCDPGCPLTGSMSQLGHTGIAVVFFGSISLAPLLFSLGLDHDPFWKSLRNYSLATGLLSLVGLGAFSWSVLAMFTYIGLVQRLFLAVPFQWIGIMAYHLRLSGKL